MTIEQSISLIAALVVPLLAGVTGYWTYRVARDRNAIDASTHGLDGELVVMRRLQAELTTEVHTLRARVAAYLEREEAMLRNIRSLEGEVSDLRAKLLTMLEGRRT